VESDLGWALGAVMRSYLRAGEPRSQVALAQHLGVDRTVMTYLLDDLEAAGLVERRPDPADRRARRVVLTEAGNAQLCELERHLSRAEKHLLEPLEPAERDVLRNLLRRLAISTTSHGADACSVVGEVEELQERAPVRRQRARR
jgi:DNA-binding MarR family transcriptional regulator